MDEGTDLSTIAPADASQTQEELNSSIDQVLANNGYHVEQQAPEKPAETTTPETPTEPTEPEKNTTEPETPTEVEETETTEPEEPEVPEEAPKPTAPTIDPQELVLEVEDAEGNKFTLKPGDNLDQALADFVPKNNGQIMQLLHDFAKLEAKQSAFEDQVAEQTRQEAEAAHAQELQQRTLTNWDNEIAGLQELGDLPMPKSKPGTDAWNRDPDVQKIDQVFQFMTKENLERAKDGRPAVSSFTQAFYMQQKAAEEAKKADEIKQENAEAKAKAALVGRSSSPANSAPEPYVAGSAKSIWDVR